MMNEVNMTDSDITVIESHCEFNDRVSEIFYNNFSPDDWSFIIIADDKDIAIKKAKSLHIHAIDIQVAKIGNEFWVVTYHS